MKNIISLLALIVIYNCAYADLPPVRAAGQGGTLAPAFNIYTAPNQVTKIGAVSQLLELGNDNLLANPDFEHATAGQSWTSGAGTLSNQTTGQAKGSQALKIALAAQTLNISQTVSTHSSLAGNQAEAVLWAKSTTSTSGGALLFGSKIDGTESAVSVPVVLTSNWQRLSIPFVSGSSSQGLFLKSTTGITNDIFVDNAYVKMGEVKNTSSVVSSWQSYTPTFTGFGTVTSPNIRWRQVGSSIEISGTFVLGSTSATEQRISLPSGHTGATNMSALEYTGGDIISNVNLGVIFKLMVLREPSVSYVTFGQQLSGTGGLVKIAATGPWPGSGNTMSFNATVPVNELSGNVSTYSSSGGHSSLYFYDSTATNWSRTGTITDQLYSTSGTTVTNIGAGLSSVNNSVDGFKVTALTSGILTFTATVPLSNGTGVYFKKNGTQFTSSNVQNDGTNSPTGNSFTIFANQGDYFTVNSTGLDTTRNISFFATLIPNLINGSFKEVVTTPGVASPEIINVSWGATTVSNECNADPCFYDQGAGTRITAFNRTAPGGDYTVTFNKTFTKLWMVSGSGTTNSGNDQWIRGFNGGVQGNKVISNSNTFRFSCIRYNLAAQDDCYGTATFYGY